MPSAGMSAAAALLEATGIDPAAPVWGAPFREMAALYDGADPPLETFGVSAKFSNGKAATARYYVALELPGVGGHLPRDAQRLERRVVAVVQRGQLAEGRAPDRSRGVDARRPAQRRGGCARPRVDRPAVSSAAGPWLGPEDDGQSRRQGRRRPGAHLEWLPLDLTTPLTPGDLEAVGLPLDLKTPSGAAKTPLLPAQYCAAADK